MGEANLVGRRQSGLQRRLGPRSRCWQRLSRRFQGGRLVDHVGCETGVLQLPLIGGLDDPGVRLQQRVLTRKVGLGPGQQVLAGGQGCELAQQLLAELGRGQGPEHRGTVENTLGGLGAQAWWAVRLRGRRAGHRVGRIQIAIPTRANRA